MVYGSHQESLKFSPVEFKEFRDYLQEVAGIDLGDNKQYLVASRVRKILIEYQCASLRELTQMVRQSSQLRLRQLVIDAMTTNETFWFRDTYPYDHLAKVLLPDIIKKNGTTRTRIWSAACSSGQEPYSISMVVEEFIKSTFGVNDVPLEITATDLSSEILDAARRGIYDRLSITRGLSDQRLREFFEPLSDDKWMAKERIKKRINFRPLNLKDSYVSLGRFDVVFCRNVLIYFSQDLKADIIRRIHSTLKPGGYLFLGASESLAGSKDIFEMVHCSPGAVYKAL